MALCYTGLVAQSTYFNITESQKFKDKNKTTVVEAVYTTDTNETIVARSTFKNLIFEIYDNKANIVFNYEAPLNKRESIVGELFYGNTLKIFTVFSPTKTERVISCHLLNIVDETYKKIELYNTTVEKRQLLFSGQNKRQTNFSISPNEQFLAIATDNIKKNINSYLIHVFDAQTLQLLYTKEYYSNEEKFFQSSDMAIDNSGNIYNLGKEYIKGRKDKKDNKANYTFVLNKINKESIETQHIALGEQEYIESLRIIFKEDTMNFVGFYSEERSGRIKGIIQIKIDNNTLAVLEKKSFKLPKEVYEGIYGYRKAVKKSKKELRSFYLDYFLEDEFGNVYIVAEEFYVTQSYVSNGMNGGGYWATTYHYDDILILKFNTEGKLEWGRSIFKKDGSPSYYAFTYRDKLHIFLNSGKNLKEKKDGRVKVSKSWFESSVLYDFVYDKDGNVTREVIQENKGKTRYIPYSGSFRDGKFIMFNHSKNRKRLMILEAKN